MAKKIVGFIKLQIPAGKANPAPPVGPALGQRGLNIMEFCKAFNAKTQSMEPGLPIPVVITAYADKSFTFIMKTPPATILIKKAAKIQKGSARPQAEKARFDSGRYGCRRSHNRRLCSLDGRHGGGNLRWLSFPNVSRPMWPSMTSQSPWLWMRLLKPSRPALRPNSTSPSTSRFSSASMCVSPIRLFAAPL